MLLLIDNYDSFVYILKQYFEECGQEVLVKRNDEITIQEAQDLNPEYLVISPGPATPHEAGVSIEMIKHFAGKLPILGVCLGHQCIGEIYGGKIIRNPLGVRHGKRSPILHEGKGIFSSLPSPVMATRYHSLVIEKESFPEEELEITAWTKEGEIMGVRHKKYGAQCSLEGVQFHPESYLTENGMQMIKNFLSRKQEKGDLLHVQTAHSFSELIKKVCAKNDLTLDEAIYCAQQIMDGNPSQIQVSGFLMALSIKGETYEEITGFVNVMREKVTPIIPPDNKLVIDTCGTGGDAKHTFNVSTLAALVAASCGATVAKHGNRSVSSLCGSADILEKLGVNIDLTPQRSSQVMQKVGIAFLFAQKLHTSMKNVAPIRKELGVRTIFNILGPLTNPAGAQAQVIGVFANKYVGIVSKALRELGTKEALVLHSEDGLDEISVSDKTYFAHLKDGKITEGYIDSVEIVGRKYSLEEIKGGSAEDNAGIARALLENRVSGALKDIILINAAAALLVAGICDTIKEGYQLAKEALESGKTKKKLEELIVESNK